MKSSSIASRLAPAAVAVMGMLLFAPVHPAAAGGANGAKATLGTKITTGVGGHPGAVGKLQCVGSYCPLSGAGYKAATTGTYKPIAEPTSIVRDHRGAGPRTKPTRQGPKRETICAGWGC